VEWYPVLDKDGVTNGYGLVVQDITQAKINEGYLIEKEQRIVKMNQELEDKVSQRTAELAASNQALTQLIRIDFLTGLPNRLAGQEQIRLEYLRMKRGHSFYALMIIDIDHFKLINDVYGHEFGDIKLKSVSSILQKSIRDSDFVARWGGEEFIVLLRDTHGSDALHIADKLRLLVQNNIDEIDINVSISIGVSSSNPDDEGPDAILTRADKLLYRAKNNGRNQCCSDAA
jgi:diguanylate cyclase